MTYSSSSSTSESHKNLPSSSPSTSPSSASNPSSLLNLAGSIFITSWMTPSLSLINSSSSIFCSMFAAIKAFCSLMRSLLSAFFLIGTISVSACRCIFLILFSICRSFVSLCLHLWTMNSGQQMSCQSSCSKAVAQFLSSLTFSQSLLGVWALSAVFMQRQHTPFYSRTVAYWEFARGQDLRLHSPVRLNSLRQKFWASALTRKEQCLLLITDQTTQSMIISTINNTIGLVTTVATPIPDILDFPRFFTSELCITQYHVRCRMAEDLPSHGITLNCSPSS